MTCSVIPPARPPTTGRPFHSASLTVRPNPSRTDFWTITVAIRWNALICTDPTWCRFERRWMSRSPSRASSVSSQTRNPSGSSVAIDPASSSCASGTRSRTTPERVDHPDRVLPRVVAADLAHDRALRVHPVLAGELLAERPRQIEVLHRQRVDARREHDDVVHLQRRGHERLAGSTPTRRAAPRRAGRTPTRSGSRRSGRCGSATPTGCGPRCRGRDGRGGSATARRAAGRGRRRSPIRPRAAARCRGSARGRRAASPGSTRCRRLAARCGPAW